MTVEAFLSRKPVVTASDSGARSSSSRRALAGSWPRPSPRRSPTAIDRLSRCPRLGCARWARRPRRVATSLGRGRRPPDRARPVRARALDAAPDAAWVGRARCRTRARSGARWSSAEPARAAAGRDRPLPRGRPPAHGFVYRALLRRPGIVCSRSGSSTRSSTPRPPAAGTRTPIGARRAVRTATRALRGAAGARRPGRGAAAPRRHEPARAGREPRARRLRRASSRDVRPRCCPAAPVAASAARPAWPDDEPAALPRRCAALVLRSPPRAEAERRASRRRRAGRAAARLGARRAAPGGARAGLAELPADAEPFVAVLFGATR